MFFSCAVYLFIMACVIGFCFQLLITVGYIHTVYIQTMFSQECLTQGTKARQESRVPWQSSSGWPGVRLGLPTVLGHHHCHILPALAASPNVVYTGPCAAGVWSSGWWMLKNKLVWKNGCSKKYACMCFVFIVIIIIYIYIHKS